MEQFVQGHSVSFEADFRRPLFLEQEMNDANR